MPSTFSSVEQPAFSTDWDRIPLRSIPTKDIHHAMRVAHPKLERERVPLFKRLGLSEATTVGEAIEKLGDIFYNALRHSAFHYSS